MIRMALVAAVAGWIAAALAVATTVRDRGRVEAMRVDLERCESYRSDLLRALEEQRAAVDQLRAELASAEDRARHASLARDEAVRRIAALRRARPAAEPDVCSAVELPAQTRAWLTNLARGGRDVQ